MAGIFISYRREDSAGYVALLYRDLSASFGRDRVFMDIHTLQPGQDFVASLEEAVGECAVLLAVIGPHWVTATDEDGNRRLNKPNDYVALEIGSALARSDILVIPVRVGKAQRPSPGDLPEPLLALARRQDFELTDKRWDYDVETLIKRLETVVTPVEPKAPPQQSAEGESTEAVDYRVWLEPERTHGSGAERVGLVIENLSPRSMTFAIAPRRKDARLDVRVEAEQVQIGAQSKITVGVELTPRLEEDLPPALLTGDPQTLTYAVNVGPSDAPAAARDFTGEYLLMPAVVALRLAKQEVLSPGAATFALQIRNPGSQPIVVALEAEDFTGQCHFTFDRQELTIDPQVVELVTLTVTPPQQHASDASWAFDVRARPTSPAGHPVTVQGSLVFAPERFAVRLPQPEIEASGTGTFTVEVENLGATEIAVEMRAADAAGVCTYEFDQPSAVLAPGSITQFDLRVTPPRDHPPDARWAFDVLVSPPWSQVRPLKASGLLVYRPPTVTLSINPLQQSSRRTAAYEISVHHSSSLPQTVRLTAADAGGHLSMRWPNRQDHAEATVGARQTTVVPLEVSSLLRHRGSGPRSLYFDVTATLVKPPGPKVQTQAQFDVLPERLGPGRLLEQTWTRRLLLAIGAVILVALLFDVSGLLRPVVVIAVAPLIGGILLRSVWWIVLYPLGLAAVLVAAGQEVVRDAFNISAPRPSWAELGPPGDYLNDVFAAINYLTPNDIQERLTQESLGLFDPQLSYIRSCELGRDFGSQRELCTTADWNILVLAALCALIGTMLGKLVFRRPDVPTC